MSFFQSPPLAVAPGPGQRGLPAPAAPLAGTSCQGPSCWWNYQATESEYDGKVTRTRLLTVSTALDWADTGSHSHCVSASFRAVTVGSPPGPTAASNSTKRNSPQLVFGFTSNTLFDLVRVHPGRSAAHPTATGWDEELRARTASVLLPRQGRSESSFRTDPSICPVMLRLGYR